jgi:hypothetical protein
MTSSSSSCHHVGRNWSRRPLCPLNQAYLSLHTWRLTSIDLSRLFFTYTNANQATTCTTILGQETVHTTLSITHHTTRKWGLEHQIFSQHHTIGCNNSFYGNEEFFGLRYLDIMATKNVGCVVWNNSCNRLLLMPPWNRWLPLWYLLPQLVLHCDSIDLVLQ